MPSLIAVPQESEMDGLIAGFRSAGLDPVPTRLGKLDAFEILSLDSLLAVAGHGKTQFATTTSFLLSHRVEIDQVICVGAAGTLTSTLTIGDIVVSTATVEHDYQIKF